MTGQGEAPEPYMTAAVTRITGARPVARHVVRRGHTAAVRAVYRLADSRSVFVKAAFEPVTLGWLRSEWLVYGQVVADFVPRVHGWEDEGDRAVLVLEDLSGHRWPTGWSVRAVALVRAAIERVNATPAPPGLPPLADRWPPADSGWTEVARDPAPFLSLGLASPAWLDAALPELHTAVRDAPMAGNAFIHFDIRSDNICLLPRRAVLVDWNWAARANPLVDLVAWLPSLAAEGGPPPVDLGPGTAGIAATFCGFWASRAGTAPPPGGADVRALQRRQLEVALPWACRLLGLPEPDGPRSTSGSGQRTRSPRRRT